MNKGKYISLSPEDTYNFGIRLVEEEKIKLGDVIALYGDLGAGKTALSKGIAKGLGIEETVTSPTFSIVNFYEIKSKKYFYHFDMYRIQTEDDLYSLDFFDYLNENSIVIIEWFENIEDFLDEDEKKTIKRIQIKKDESSEEKREIYLDLDSDLDKEGFL